MLNIPSIDACLELKDELGISDHNWKRVEDVFKLPKELRRYKLIQYRRLTAKPPHKTPRG